MAYAKLQLLSLPSKSSVKWFRNGANRIPSSTEPTIKGRRAHIGSSCPLGKVRDFAIYCEHPDVRRAVRVLFDGRCPDAVTRLVSSVSVGALNRHSCGTIAHILVEAGELHPLLTHGDAATAVAVEVFVSSVRAPLHHGAPRLPCWRPGHPMRRSSRSPSVLGAAAACALAAAEVAAFDRSLCPAVAPTEPSQADAPTRVTTSENRPHAESFSGQFNERSHGF